MAELDALLPWTVPGVLGRTGEVFGEVDISETMLLKPSLVLKLTL